MFLPFWGQSTEQKIPWHSFHWEVQPILLPFAAPRNAAVLGKSQPLPFHNHDNQHITDKSPLYIQFQVKLLSGRRNVLPPSHRQSLTLNVHTDLVDEV